MNGATSSASNVSSEPWVEVTGSPHLSSWLAEHQVSLAFTTYQTGKLFLLGRHPDGRLAVFERSFNRAMGLWADGQTLWLSTLYQLSRFENLLRPGEGYQGYDRLYVPKTASTTGDLDIHDIAIDADGRPLFVATAFGCIATLSERWSFKPLWRPSFLSRLAAEDRCHLNGLALAEGRPRYCDRGQHQRCGRRLARPAPGGRGRAGDPRRPRDCLRAIHAPLATTVSRPALAAQLRDRPVRQYRSCRRGIRAADLLPGLLARPRVRRKLRRGGTVSPPPRQDVRRPGLARRSSPSATRKTGAACWSSTCAAATSHTGCAWKEWFASSTTWPHFPRFRGPWPWASRRTKSNE